MSNSGAVLRAAFGGSLSIQTKSHARDLVTQADTASEQAILGALRDRWPEVGLVAEESGVSRPGAEATWIIGDYIDVVVHVFTPEAREFYRLEDLWDDVPHEALEAATA